MSEIALVSAKKFKLENLATKGSANAKKVIPPAEKPNTFLSTVQIGITLLGILTDKSKKQSRIPFYLSCYR